MRFNLPSETSQVGVFTESYRELNQILYEIKYATLELNEIDTIIWTFKRAKFMTQWVVVFDKSRRLGIK